MTGISAVGYSRKGITAVTLGFDEALDPGSAGNVGFYSLESGVKKRYMLVFSTGVKIGGVSYDGTAHTVTLKLAKPTKGPVQVTVRSGILGADGESSRGDFTAVVK